MHQGACLIKLKHWIELSFKIEVGRIVMMREVWTACN